MVGEVGLWQSSCFLAKMEEGMVVEEYGMYQLVIEIL